MDTWKRLLAVLNSLVALTIPFLLVYDPTTTSPLVTAIYALQFPAFFVAAVALAKKDFAIRLLLLSVFFSLNLAVVNFVRLALQLFPGPSQNHTSLYTQGELPLFVLGALTVYGGTHLLNFLTCQFLFAASAKKAQVSQVKEMSGKKQPARSARR